MWSRRAASSDGIRFCYGTVSVSEKIAPCAWTLELPASWLFGSLQLLQKCCFRFHAFLVLFFFLLACILLYGIWATMRPLPIEKKRGNYTLKSVVVLVV